MSSKGYSNEKLFSFLDDLYVVAKPERIVEIYGILSEELWGIEERLRLLEEQRLVRRAASLRHEEELVLVALAYLGNAIKIKVIKTIYVMVTNQILLRLKNSYTGDQL